MAAMWSVYARMRAPKLIIHEPLNLGCGTCAASADLSKSIIYSMASSCSCHWRFLYVIPLLLLALAAFGGTIILGKTLKTSCNIIIFNTVINFQPYLVSLKQLSPTLVLESASTTAVFLRHQPFQLHWSTSLPPAPR